MLTAGQEAMSAVVNDIAVEMTHLRGDMEMWMNSEQRDPISTFTDGEGDPHVIGGIQKQQVAGSKRKRLPTPDDNEGGKEPALTSPAASHLVLSGNDFISFPQHVPDGTSI